jgi:hypothetical protein
MPSDRVSIWLTRRWPPDLPIRPAPKYMPSDGVLGDEDSQSPFRRQKDTRQERAAAEGWAAETSSTRSMSDKACWQQLMLSTSGCRTQ